MQAAYQNAIAEYNANNRDADVDEEGGEEGVEKPDTSKIKATPKKRGREANTVSKPPAKIGRRRVGGG